MYVYTCTIIPITHENCLNLLLSYPRPLFEEPDWPGDRALQDVVQDVIGPLARVVVGSIRIVAAGVRSTDRDTYALALL